VTENPADSRDGRHDVVFLGLLEDFAGRASGDWRVLHSEGPGGAWIHVERPSARLPDNGWKLHISATPWSAHGILRAVLPVLLAEDAGFKVAASVSTLAELNEGAGGLSQIGKFVTIYPNDDSQAVRLAASLDKVTQGLQGPPIPSDRPLAPGSLVHYRFGPFVVRGLEESAKRLRPEYSPPAGVDDPFVAAGIAKPPEEKPPGGRYFVTSTLHHSVAGAVYLAVDLVEGRSCVLKKARRHARLMPDGRDARDDLRHEAEVLKRLSPDPYFPTVFDVFEDDGDVFVAMELIDGRALGRYVHARHHRGATMSKAELLAWARDLTKALAKIHAMGMVYRDLNPVNVIVSREGGLRLVDFELTQAQGTATLGFTAGTPGYLSPQQAGGLPAEVTDDVFGLGAVLYLAATGTDPGDDGASQDGVIARIVAANPGCGSALASVIARSLEREAAARWRSMEEVASALEQADQAE
jgi:tRNA A-37 threonylcarbamoyl transferase component Bud32